MITIPALMFLLLPLDMGVSSTFSVAVPEGNYRVTVTLGDAVAATETTVKAEARRVMLNRVVTNPGEMVTRTFDVNVRYREIVGGGEVKLKARELEGLNWDHKLSLEFSGARPGVQSVEVAPLEKAITVYLAGDSTVVDQDREPWAAWGQMLPQFFRPGVVIANHAESGEALRSFVAERRLDKILTTIRAGDYLFIQFAHNDMKPGVAYAEAFSTYQELLTRFVGEARQRGATPVLVTSMHRRTFDAEGRITNSLLDYPEAMRQTARKLGVALIDLHAMSQRLYEAWGPEVSKKAFVHYAAGTFVGQEAELKDNTHFNASGAEVLARCVVEGIRDAKLPLGDWLVEGLPRFDPGQPEGLGGIR